MNILWIFIFVCSLMNKVAPVNIFRFTDNREEDTGAKILTRPGQNVKVTDLTFCFDVFVTLIRSFSFVRSKGSKDLSVTVPSMCNLKASGTLRIMTL